MAVAGAFWLATMVPMTSAGVGAGLEALRGDWPRAGGGTTRAGNITADPSPDAPYAFTGTAGQAVVAFDPCDPVRYVIAEQGRPDGSDELVFEAVGDVAAATGLDFVYEGLSSERPSTDREKYQPALYGDRWAPVLIAWSGPAEVQALEGPAAGLGGSTPVKAGSQPWVYATGQVILDAPQLGPLLGDRDGAGVVRAVIGHELGHVAGLAHVGDPDQLMNPEAGEVAVFAAGDLEGLSVLGRGSCVAEY